MKPGDLVTFGDRHGVIVEDHTMMSYWPDPKAPERIGGMLVLSEGKVSRVVYALLRAADESR